MNEYFRFRSHFRWLNEILLKRLNENLKTLYTTPCNLCANQPNRIPIENLYQGFNIMN